MISYSFNINDEVHIWKYDIGRALPDFLNANTILSREEKLRASNFIHLEDKKRYIAVHLFLRNVLSKYTGNSASELEFISGLNNKPFLKNNKQLFFNLSYRNNYALLGVSNKDNIGVDIEKTRSVDDVYSFTADYFSIEERDKINKIKNESEQLSLLFTFWSMKEAVIKALAVGFSNPLPNYNLSSFLDSQYSYPDFDRKNSWCVQHIEVNKNYKAAFAIRTNMVKLKLIEYV